MFSASTVSGSNCTDPAHRYAASHMQSASVLTACLRPILTRGRVDRRTDPGDRDRMLFYLLIKKDGTTAFPAPDAVHPDLTSSSLPPRGDSTPQPAAAPAVAATHLQQNIPQAPHSLKSPAAEAAAEAAVKAAAEAVVQNVGDQAVPTSHASGTQVSTADSDQPAGKPSGVSPHPDPSMQQGLQQAAGCDPGPCVPGSSGSLPHASASNPQADAPSLPAVSASPQLSHSSQLPQPLLPQPAPASPQLQPASPQLQPASPHLPPSSPQPAASAHQANGQQLNQQLQGQASETAAGQDISKEFLALLQETSTHLAGSQPSWPNQTASDPSTAGHQSAASSHSERPSNAIDAEGLRPCDNGTATVDRRGPPATSPSSQAPVGDEGIVSSHMFHLLMLKRCFSQPWVPSCE